MPLPVVAPPPRRRAADPLRPPARLVIPAVLLLLLVIGYLLLRSLIVSVTILPPRAPELVVSTVLERSAAAALALRPIERQFDVQIRGNLAAKIPLPLGRAGGALVLRNRGDTAIELPDRSLFLAAATDGGAPIEFAAAGTTVVPAASRVSSTLGELIVPGEARLMLSAINPGSRSNVGADTIQALRLPDGRVVALTSDKLSVSHAAFSGGSERTSATLQQADVDAAVEAQRGQLAALAEDRLRSAADAAGLTLITSGGALLERIAAQPLLIEPPLGTQLSAAASSFTVTMRIDAAAQGAPFNGTTQREALLPAFTAALQRDGLLPGDDCHAARLDRLSWNGDAIAADGAVFERADCMVQLAVTTQVRLRDELRGLDETAARALLERYRADGVIGDYYLPPQATLPAWSWFIDLRTP